MVFKIGQIPTTTRVQERKCKHNIDIKVNQDSILIIEVYIDDIIFVSDDEKMSQKFSKNMKNEFKMSLLGELSLFLGLQIYQINKGNFIFQNKYIR